MAVRAADADQAVFNIISIEVRAVSRQIAIRIVTKARRASVGILVQPVEAVSARHIDVAAKRIGTIIGAARRDLARWVHQ